MEERRAGRFPERLSMVVVIVAALGAFLVLLDPKIELLIGAQKIAFGGDGFSSELKGAVITIMLIGGWTAVMGFWLGASNLQKPVNGAPAPLAPIAPIAPIAPVAPIAPLAPLAVPAADPPATGTP